MIRAICWDMDGLIFNTEIIYRKSWESAAAKQNLVIPDVVYLDFIGRQDWECEERLFAFFEGQLDMDKFRKERTIDFDQRLTCECEYKDGFVELIQTAASKGLKQALVTSSTLPEVERNFAGTTYLEYFSVVVTAERVSSGKPAPDCYLLACRQLGVNPTESLVLEDSYNGVQSALQAGCMPVMIPDLVAPAGDLSKEVRVVSGLLDVIPLLSSVPYI